MTIENATQVDQFLFYSLSEKRSNTRRYSAIHQDRQAMMSQVSLTNLGLWSAVERREDGMNSKTGWTRALTQQSGSETIVRLAHMSKTPWIDSKSANMFLPCSKITPSLKGKVTATGKSLIFVPLDTAAIYESWSSGNTGTDINLTFNFGSYFVSYLSHGELVVRRGNQTTGCCNKTEHSLFHCFEINKRSLFKGVISVLNSPTWTIRYRSVMTIYHH